MKCSLNSVLLCLLILSAISCTRKSAGDDCNTQNITYTNTVKNIFDSNCTLSGCHNSGSFNGSLTTYDEAINFPNLNKMVGALRHQNGFEPMPQGTSALDVCQIDQIEAWIANGTPN